MWKEYKPKPREIKGIERGKERAEKANAAGDAVKKRMTGKSPGKMTRKERKEGRGQK
jgi:hypothetical protein